MYSASGTRLIAEDTGGTTLHLGLMDLRLVGTVVTATRYYSFNGEMVAQRTSAGVQWICSDPQGSQQVTVSVDGLTVNRRRQTPYGQDRGTSQPWANPKGFVGGHKDPTGLVHIGARQYDQTLGAFVSVDPIIDFGDIGQMNAYSYANNNPVTFSDPSGLKYEIYTGSFGGGWGDRCEDVVCGFVEGFGSRFDLMGAVKAAVKTVSNPSKAIKQVGDDVKEWTEKTGDPAAGMACALTGLCEMFETCATAHFSADCGRALGEITADIIVGALTAGSASLASRLVDLARRMNIDIPKSIKDRNHISADTNPSPPGSNDGGNTPEERAAQNQSSPTGSGDGGGGGGGGSGGGGKGCHSFDPSTRVLLADGSTKAISDIKLGDKVTATEPRTGETTAKAVTALHHNLDTELADVTVTNDQTGETTTVKTTANHPFWDSTAQAWADAATLVVGHQLQVHLDELEGDSSAAGLGGGDPGRTTVTVTAVAHYIGSHWMRDLTVADIHTYYVVAGDTPVLVHNCNLTVVSSDQSIPHNHASLNIHGQHGFAGVYDPTTGGFEARLSGGPDAVVSRRGGHGDIDWDVFGSPGNTVGFTATRNGNVLEISWNSASVNHENFGHVAAPNAHRSAIMDALRRATGFDVRG